MRFTYQWGGVMGMRNAWGVMLGLLGVMLFAGGCRDGGVSAVHEIEVTPEVEQVTAANNQFAVDLYLQLQKEHPGENLFFSPYSISTALAMTAEGARGQTAEEMGAVLGYPKELHNQGDAASQVPWSLTPIHAGIALIDDYLSCGGIADTENWCDIRIANALWGEKAYPFAETYLSVMEKHYGGKEVVFSADFRNNAEAACKQINAWGKEQTNGRIQNIISPETLSKDTRLVLTNAVYFKGNWAEQFNQEKTRDEPFFLADGKQVIVPMMCAKKHQKCRYGTFAIEDGSPYSVPWKHALPEEKQEESNIKDYVSIIELPYVGDALTMVVIVPNKHDGLANLEAKLTSKQLTTWMEKIYKQKTNVYLPRFKLETNYLLGDANQVGTLQKMGMKRAFDPRPKGPKQGADFGGLCDSSNPEHQLYISQVLHKAFVEVNEEGTEAAAVTVVHNVKKSASRPIADFRADRPFLFFLRDNKTGTILFLGRVMKP